MIIKRDRHYFALSVTSMDTLRIDNTDISLNVGTYWSHYDTSLTVTYPSIYQMICLRIASVYGGSWTIRPATPSGYTLRSGVRLRCVSGATPATLDLTATSPLIKRVLGFGADDTDVVSFVDGVVNSSYAAYGSWSPWSFFEGRAEVKDSHMERVVNWSSTHPEAAQAVIWRERKYRMIRYPYVFGSYVHQNRSSYESYAHQAGMATGDFNNSLENLWMNVGRNIGDIIVVYDMDELDLQVTSHEYEVVKFAKVEATRSMSNLATRSMIAADVWDVSIPYVVIGGSYGL